MVRAGLGSTNWRCRFANDFDPKKSAAYRRNWRDAVFKTGDVRALTTDDLPGTVDLTWASFPCQDLSLAGGGAGLQGDRSGTFWPFWNLMKGLISTAPSVDVATATGRALTTGKLRGSPPSDIEKWSLSQFIEVAAEMGVLKDKTVISARLCNDFRNLIHPGRGQRLGESCNRGTAYSAVGALEHVIVDLSQDDRHSPSIARLASRLNLSPHFVGSMKNQTTAPCVSFFKILY